MVRGVMRDVLSKATYLIVEMVLHGRPYHLYMPSL